jgi:hypothetical protein
VLRGDNHYGRVEAMEWIEDFSADYFGLGGHAALDALVAETSGAIYQRGLPMFFEVYENAAGARLPPAD